MASAAFHFDAQASLVKKSATPSGTVTLTLDSTDGVRSVLWSVPLTCENSAAAWTVTGSTSNNATLNVPSGTDKACIVLCTINGGTPTGTEDVADLTATAKVYTGTEVVVAGEGTESDQTYGWAPLFNDLITSGGGGVSLSNTAASDVGTASAGVGATASRYDHVHAHGTQLGGTLHADASGAAAGFMTAAHYTLVNTAAEAPTVSVIPIRTSAGNLRCVGATCETATDADRYVRGTGADGTTLAAMRVEGSSIILGRKTADAYNKLVCAPAADGSALTLSVTSSAGASNPISIGGSTARVWGTSVTQSDSANGYAAAYTPAAAATLVYANDLTSLTSRIAQKAAGAGAARYILGGLGASGSANGVFVSGLENGNTVLGGEHWLAAGSLVSNVSNKVRFGTGTPGSMTSFLDFYQSALNTTTIVTPWTVNFTCTSGNMNLLSTAGSWGATSGNYVTLTPAAAYYVDVKACGIDNAGPYSSPANSVAFAASQTLNANLSDHHVIAAMTANTTSLTMSNVRAGSVFTVKVLQDGTGSWTITWNASFIFGATHSNVPKAAANSVTVWRFFAEGTTTWRCIGREEYTS